VLSASWLEGVVQAVMRFGIFVEVKGQWGLIHPSHLVVDLPHEASEEVEDSEDSERSREKRALASFRLGQKVKVRVLNACVASGRLSLSMKPYSPVQDNAEPTSESQLEPIVI